MAALPVPARTRRPAPRAPVHIGGRGLRVRVPHQVPQRQQVNARRRELGAVGVTQPVRPDPDRARGRPVGAEDPPHPGLGQRRSGGRAAQDHEAFRCPAAGRALLPQVGSQLGEERAVHRDNAFLAALARHPDPAQSHVHSGQPQRPHLGGPQPAQQHRQRDRPVPEGAQVREEHRHVAWLEGLGQPACLPRRRPPRGLLVPTCPSRPRWLARRPLDRRAAGTGLTSRTPLITANSNRPRTAAIRRFIVDGAAPRCSAGRTTRLPAVPAGRCCQAR